jgi:thiamine biosynthesis protein ThiS
VIEIVLNGEAHTVPAGTTLLGLIEGLGIEPDRVAIELDHEIIRRPLWAERGLNQGSRLEVVHFVGGG